MTEKRFRKVLGLIQDSNGDLLNLSEIADKMNQLNNENERLKEDKEELNNKKWAVMSIIIEYDTTNKYKNADEAIDAIKKELGLVMINE